MFLPVVRTTSSPARWEGTIAAVTVDGVVIDGAAVDGIGSFYDEVNRVFMQGESWTLGPSLDALDDMLHGGYGLLAGLRDAFPVPVVWTSHASSRAALGEAATRAHLQEKLRRPAVYNGALVEEQLRALDAGTGATYFDLVLDVFAGHGAQVTLTLR